MGDSNLKKLFSQKSNKFLSAKDLTELGQDAESADYIEQYSIERERFVPPVSFDKPENFARFGSAEDYYRESVERIYKTYPYDGSRAERVEFENSSSYLDRWILDTRYPKSTGYMNINAAPTNSWISQASPTVKEYISFVGGPGTGSAALANKPLAENFAGTNVYDPAKGRGSNLKWDWSTDGTTVEFWIKLGDISYPPVVWPAITVAPWHMIFDMGNGIAVSGAASGASPYGRFMIYYDQDGGATDGFWAKWASGSVSVTQRLYTVGDGLVAANSGSWNHYTFSFKNESTGVRCKSYENGTLVKSTLTTGGLVDDVTGSLKATIGAISEDFDGALGGATAGWYKMSGSIDEFRYWKKERTAEEIGRYWFTQVGGGTNSDDANTDLGVYYKFNEGITGDTSIDSTVLDYSGRVTNGVWVGYDSTYSRNTGSAIVSSSAAPLEKEDPIIYSSHPQVDALLTDLKISGSAHDRENASSIYQSIPGWITEEDDTSLKSLTQIMSSYLDTLYLQIQHLPKIKDTAYISGSDFKPLPFAGNLLDSYGFVSPEIFADADIFEQFFNRTEGFLFDESLHEVKNTIYQNIYNNLVHIYKSKGTEKAFRNLIRCYGIGDDIVKLNIYADNSTYVYEDNFEATTQKKNVINFNDTQNFNASVYQSTSSLDSNSQAFISGTQSLSYIPRTVEANILFPKKRTTHQEGYFRTPFVTASLFGMHTSRTILPEDPTWSSPDVGNFQVFAIKDSTESPSVRFKLTGTAGGGIPSLTTDLFEGVYDNQAWNISVRVKPTKYPTADYTTDSSTTTFDVEFSGYNNILDITYNSFSLTGTMTEQYGKSFLSSSHRVFVGAHTTNFTGTVLQKSDARIAGIRYWMDYLEDDELKSHAKDFLNYGRKHPQRDAYPLISSAHRIRVPQKDTLALNWDFQQVTGSDASGLFLVDDYSSGSVSRANQMYGFLGPVLLDKHPGTGYNFEASSADVVDADYLYAARQTLPENVASSDMTQVLDNDDITFTREIRPIRHFFAFEKSMYDVVSREMIDMFATIKDFNNLVGNPVNRYRERYKDMEKLRSLFFDRIENTPDLDKYIDFYRWIDSSLGYMLNQLVPASADFADNMRNMVESHVLERNKYKTKFPTLEDKSGSPGLSQNYQASVSADGDEQSSQTGGILSVDLGESKTSNPKVVAPGNQNVNPYYWRLYAIRTESEVSSGDISVDEAREVIRKIGKDTFHRQTNSPGKFVTTFNRQSDKYLEKPVTKQTTLHGGINYSEHKRDDYIDSITEFGQQREVVTINADTLLSSSYTDTTVLENKNIKVSAKATTAKDSDGLRADDVTPFNLIQKYGTAPSGDYNNEITDSFASNVVVTNLHSDGIEVGLQGPFTQEHVGGKQSRHQPIATSPVPTGEERAEGWRIQAVAGSPNKLVFSDPVGGALSSTRHFAHSKYYRGERTKRPVNIRNISHTTASAVLGNYDQNYQVVNTTGRTANNLAYVQAGGVGFEQTTPENQYLYQEDAISALDGKINFALPSRALENSSFTKTVFANHFNAPGGKDVSSRGVLNPASEEFAAMNALPWRNRVIREKLKEDLRVHTGQFGTYPYQQYGLRFGSQTLPWSDSDLIALTVNDDYANPAGRLGLSSTTDFSVSFWLRTGRLPDGGLFDSRDTIFAVDFAAADTVVFAIHVTPTGEVAFYDGTDERSDDSGIAVNDNEWHHWVFAYSSAGFITIYKDNVDVTPTTKSVALTFSANDKVSIGSRYRFGVSYLLYNYLGGDLDELSVWSRALGSTDVDLIYDGGHPNDINGLGITGLQAWYRMGDEIAVWHDSAKSNHAKIRRGTPTAVTDVLRRKDSLVTGSFEKVNRNPRWRMEYAQPNDAVIKTVVYDNGYVTHPIPRADTQYSWIGDSYQSAETFGHATGSSEISFVTIGGLSTVQQLSTYSNNLVYAPIYSNKITLPDNDVNEGYFEDGLMLAASSFANQNPADFPGSLADYQNTSLGGAVGPSSAADYFNLLLTSRNGLTGVNTWKQTRTGQHPIARYLAKNNYHTYSEEEFVVSNVRSVGSTSKGLLTYSWPGDINVQSVTSHRQRTYFVEEPAVSFNQHPIVVDYRDPDGKYVSAFSFLNEMETFANDVLVARANMAIKKPKAYDTFLQAFKQSKDVHLNKLAMRDVIYPRTANATLAKVRGRLQYAETAAEQRAVDAGQSRLFWRDSLNDRLKNPSPGSAFTSFNTSLGAETLYRSYSIADSGLSTSLDTGASSIWPLDKNEVGDGYKAGELAQDTRLAAGFTLVANAPTQQYALSGTGGQGVAKATNELLWSADTQSGKKPWFDSYDEFAENIRRFSQTHTVIPEFKISDHMGYILNAGPDATLNNFLSIEGAATTDSDLDVSAPSETSDYTAKFFKTYVHSDFMKYFGDVKQDYEDLAKASRMALQCNVVKKLLPYQGFYPATRCMQLGTLFSASHGKSLTGLTPLGGNEEHDYLAAITQPLFAPGILYNSIKAGLGYGWPIWTTEPTFNTPPAWPTPASGQTWNGDDEMFLNIITSAPDTQLRFEDLLLDGLPLKSNIYMIRRKLYGVDRTAGADPSFNSYAQVAGNLRQLGDDSYVRAMHNFLAEVGNTFLEHGGVGTYKSQERMNWKPMKKGKVYYMDVAIYKTTDMIQAEGPGDLSGVSGQHTRGSMYGFMGLNEASIGVADTLDQDPRFAMFTPPGFYGDREYVTIAYTADDLDELIPPPLPKIFASSSITSILDQTNTSDYTPDLISTTTGILYDNRFTVTASVDLFNM